MILPLRFVDIFLSLKFRVKIKQAHTGKISNFADDFQKFLINIILYFYDSNDIIHKKNCRQRLEYHEGILFMYLRNWMLLYNNVLSHKSAASSILGLKSIIILEYLFEYFLFPKPKIPIKRSLRKFILKIDITLMQD